MEEMVTSDVITRLTKENNTLKSRCKALTDGMLCIYCSFDCENRTEDFLGTKENKESKIE